MFTFLQSGASHHINVQQYFDRISGESAATLTALEILILALTSTGVWDKLDVVNVIQGVEANSLTNLKSSSYTSVNYGTTFTALRDFAFTAPNYIDTTFTPNAVDVHCVNNSASLFVYNRVVTTPGAFMGAKGAGASDYLYLLPSGGTPNHPAYGIQNVATRASTSTSFLRFIGATRTSSSTSELRQDSTTVTSTTASAGVLPNVALYVGKIPSAASAFVGNTAAWGIGGGLTSQNLDDLRVAISAYLATIGASV